MFYLFIYQWTFGLFLPVGYYEQCCHKNFYIQAFVFHLLGIYLGVELQGHMVTLGFQVALVVKNPPVKAGDVRDMGSVPGWEDPWRRKWQSTPVFLPGKSHGQRSLVGYSPWGHKELDTTEAT